MSIDLALCIFLAFYSVGVNAAGKEDSDLDFLLFEDNEKTSGVNNKKEIPQEKEERSIRSTLDNTYQITHWKKQHDPSLDLPDKDRPGWSNLTRLGLRGEYPTDYLLTFQSDILLNIYGRENEGFNTGDDLRLDIKEAYLSWQKSPTVFFDLGRINIKNGVATGFNPTDYFKVGSTFDQNTEDVKQLRNARLGALIIKHQILWQRGALTLIASPKIHDMDSRWYTDKNVAGLNLQKSNDRSRILLKYTFDISEDIRPEIIYYNESGNHNIGLNFSKALNKKWLGYVEWNLGKRRNLVDEALQKVWEAHQIDPVISELFIDQAKNYQQQLALGVSYTTASNITTQFEYHYNQAGLSDGDLQRWFDLTNHAEDKPHLTGQFLSIRRLAKARGEPLGQQHLFMRSSWIDAGLDDLDIIGLFNMDIEDQSHLIQLEAEYKLNPNARLSLRLAQFKGSNQSDYGSLFHDQIATFQVTWDF